MKAVPTLGPDNYVTTVKKKLSYLFMHAMLARHSDDAMFDFNTVSLQYHIMLHPKDQDNFSDSVSNALNKYFLRNFDNAELEVRAEYTDDDEDFLKVIFSGRVKSNDEWFDFARQLLVSPTKGIQDLENTFSFGGSQI